MDEQQQMPVREDRREDTGAKFLDFFLGFIGSLLLIFFTVAIPVRPTLLPLLMIIAILGEMVSAVYCVKIKRRFIGYGIFTTLGLIVFLLALLIVPQALGNK